MRHIRMVLYQILKNLLISLRGHNFFGIVGILAYQFCQYRFAIISPLDEDNSATSEYTLINKNNPKYKADNIRRQTKTGILPPTFYHHEKHRNEKQAY